MTVSSTTNRKTFAGNGVTTSFATSPVVFFDTSDLVLTVVTDSTGASETLVENTDYTVTGGAGSTGTVSLAGGSSPYGAPAAGTTVVIRRVLPLTQTDDFVNNDINDAEVLEDNLDRLTMVDQQQSEEVGRALKVSSSEGEQDDIAVAGKAGYYLRRNVAGTAFELAVGDANTSTFTQSGTGAVERSVTAKLGESVSVKDFGAVGDGVTDDTAAIQAAVNACITSKASCYLPAGTYKCGALTATSRLHLYGDGMFQSTINSTVTGATDAFTITPPTSGGGNTGYHFNDFGITNVTAGNGRYGIRVTLGTNAYFSNSEFERIYIGEFGNQGLYFDNTINNADGFFTLTVRRSWITNGILGAIVGDSINIQENTITGPTTANYIGVNLSSNTGARQVVIANNNITTIGGAIYLSTVYGATIRENQCEYPSTTVAYSGSNAGLITINNSLHTVLEKNTITPDIGGAIVNPTSAVALIGTTKRTYIRNNEISQGQSNHIASEATTSMTFLYPDNRYETVNPVFSFLGTDTRGVWIAPTLTNAWVNTGGSWGSVAYYKDVSGSVTFTGSVSTGAGAVFTLPEAYCPSDYLNFLTSYDGSSTPAKIQVAPFAAGATVTVPSAPGNVGVHLEGVTYYAKFAN